MSGPTTALDRATVAVRVEFGCIRAGENLDAQCARAASAALEAVVEDVASRIQSESFCDGSKSMSDEDALGIARYVLGLDP